MFGRNSPVLVRAGDGDLAPSYHIATPVLLDLGVRV